MNIIRQFITGIGIVVTVHIILKIDYFRQLLFSNVLQLLHLFFIGYILYSLFRSLNTTKTYIKLILLGSLLFPVGFLFHLLPEVRKEALVIYPVIAITVIQLFGEYVGLKIVRPRNQDTPNQEA
jgi:hypothetical protein